MSQITIDHDLRTKLQGLHEQLKLLDESGATVGRFVPEAQYRAIVHA